MRAWGSLVFVAALAGALWRAEVEHHGWAGLRWIAYFHWAVPAGVAGFLAWVAWWVDAATPRRRLTLTLSLAAYAALAIPATEASLRMLFTRWGPPSLWVLPLFAWWLLAPTSVAVLLLFNRTPPGWRRWLASQGLFIAAFPVATALIHLAPQHGHSDLLHALKSGLLAPWLVLALGVGVPVRDGRELGRAWPRAGWYNRGRHAVE
jgi:hypothetical protein